MERKLKAEPRDSTGSGPAHRTRTIGRVPAVVYGHGMDPLHVTVDARELFHALHTDAGTNVLIDLKVNSDNFLTLPREIQRDHIRGRFLHVDFLRVARDEKITVEVPIHLVGEAPGVKEGGLIEHHLWSVQVECFPQDVPPHIEADVSGLGMNEQLRVGDLRPPQKGSILTPSEETLVSVVPPQVLRVEEEEEAAAEEAELAEAAAAEGAEAEGGEAPPEESPPEE
jgi:large subunit ribosomal protein L25